ncbi:MAG: hypothetical protein ACT4PQ_14685, partial [Betaproteobacteria bacterium]
VYVTEPTTSSPLFELPQIVVTPHLGASTDEAQDRAGTDVARSVQLALAGEFVPDAVNVQVGGVVGEEVRPWLPLVQKLGIVLHAVAGRLPSAITVDVSGELAAEDDFPGDYTAATTNIVGVSAASVCGGPVVGNGNGNGRIETTNSENVLAWEHLSKAGFVTGTYTCLAAEGPTTSPVNPYGVYMQVVFDGIYGAGDTTTPSPLRHNIKSGSQVPVEIIAEMDRKIDDGAPNTGGFQFSRYQGNGASAPTDGAAAQPACTNLTTAAGIWNTTNGSTNCGGASLL